MNKGVKIALGISLIGVFVAQIVLIVSSATYDWTVIFVQFAVLLLGTVIWALVVLNKMKKCVEAFNCKNYQYVLQHKKMLFFLSATNIEKHYFYYMLAISCLKIGDEAQFLQYIYKIDNSTVNVRKYAWLTIYAAIKNNPEDFDKWQAALAKSDESEEKNFYIRFIALVCSRRQEQQELSWDDLDALKNELQ